MAIRKIKENYYVYFRDIGGKIVTRTLNTTSEARARELESQYMRLIRVRRQKRQMALTFPDLLGNPDTDRIINRITVETTIAPPPEVSNRLRLDKMPTIAAKKHKLSYTMLNAWKRFVSAMKKRKILCACEVTPAIAQKYLEEHYGNGNGKSYNNNKSTLNTFFRCCLVEAELSVSPFAPIVNRTVTSVKHHRNLTDNEIRRLMAVLPQEIQAATMLSRYTAQRLETCLRITPAMLDFDRKVFIIKPTKTERFNKWVCCPILPPLEKYLLPIIKDLPPNTSICQSLYGEGKLKPQSVSKVFRDTVQSLKIPDTAEGIASFHSLRGSAITYFKEHGINGEVLRDITGHATKAVEDIYAKATANIAAIARNWKE